VVERRYCIIGAGYSGLAAAKAFADLGVAFDHVEATDAIGGNWSHGVYDSTHLISSKSVTQYADYPMPAEYPDFPSAAQMRDYLRDFARHFGLDRRIEFNTTVKRAEPLDRRGKAGWQVEFDGGEMRKYAGVVVANGHYWRTHIPSYPGEFTGKQIHSKDYKRPKDLDGPRVLVVGAGNSGCDLAVESALTFGTSSMSLRRGHWFIPKYVLGIPIGELDRLAAKFPGPWPRVLEKAVFRAVIGIGIGRSRSYGLPAPTHGVFDQDIIVNSQLGYFLKHGRIAVHPEIDRFDGRTVHFVDGSCSEFDTIVWATGFRTSFPFLPDGLLSWEKGQPHLIGHLFPPGLANLYMYGLVAPRAGAGDLLTRSARMLAKTVCLQERMPAIAVGDVLELVNKPESNILAGGPELRWQISRTKPLLKLLHTLTGIR
jgi:cation diffusion facilitator CzcD-associated flavoprotein CzcO